MRSKRINTGIYEINHKNRTFLIERVYTGEWQLVELVTHFEVETPEYWNHFVTKWEAMRAIEEELK